MTAGLRWGILGAARIAQQEVVPAMSQIQRGSLVAVASRRPEAARELAEPFNARVHASYDALLADEEVDAVYVALPNALHLEWVVAALRAGKHVLCEKPLGMRADEVAEMAVVAAETGLILSEGMMWRHSARLRRARMLIADGAIGELRYIRVRYAVRSSGLDDIEYAASTFRYSSALGGGAIADLGCYCADAAATLSGDSVTRLEARRRCLAGFEVETAFDARLEYPSGLVAHLFGSMEVGAGSEIEILGSSGAIRMPTSFRVRPADAPLRLHVIHERDHHVEKFEFEDLYRLELEHFTDVVLDGVAPVVPLEDSLRTATLIDAIRAAPLI